MVKRGGTEVTALSNLIKDVHLGSDKLDTRCLYKTEKNNLLTVVIPIAKTAVDERIEHLNKSAAAADISGNVALAEHYRMIISSKQQQLRTIHNAAEAISELDTCE